MIITVVDIKARKINGLISFIGRRVFINGKKLPKKAGSNYPAEWSEDFTIKVAQKHFKQGAYLK